MLIIIEQDDVDDDGDTTTTIITTTTSTDINITFSKVFRNKSFYFDSNFKGHLKKVSTSPYQHW